jgi:hypothetical protein
MDRIKTSANADQGLFGGMETFIALKKTEHATLMETLMMEQEVFKAFISGNPLDGLYRYIKKFSFLSVVKEKADVGNFIIIGYLKDIQRARKKGFFIKIEDISDSFEFFTSDPCGLEKFDMVIVHGYKNKTTNRIQISKIIKTSHETLKDLAGTTYDPTETVVKVKKARYGDQRQATVEKIKAETLSSPQTMTEQLIIEEASTGEGEPLELPDDGETAACDCEINNDSTSPEGAGEPSDSSPLEYAKELLNETVGSNLPLTITVQQLKTIGEVQEVVQLIKNNPGDKTAIVLDKEVQVSDYAIEALKKYVEL